jgi:hypothetical protein
VSDVHRYPSAQYDSAFGLDVAQGTQRLGLFFDGPADETLSQLQTPGLFFYPETETAHAAYRAQIADLEKATGKLSRGERDSLRRMFGLARNVVILWIRADVPQRLRSIVRGCLRP